MRPSGTGTSSLLPAVFSLCQTGLARYLVSVFLLMLLRTSEPRSVQHILVNGAPECGLDWGATGVTVVCTDCWGARVLFHCSVSVSLNQKKPDSLPSTCLAGNCVGTSCLRSRNRSVFSSSKIILFANFWRLCFALVVPLSRRIFSHSLPDKLLCTLKGPISFTQTLTPWGSGWAFSILLQTSFLIYLIRVELICLGSNPSLCYWLTDHFGQGTFLYLHFLPCKMRLLINPTLYDYEHKRESIQVKCLEKLLAQTKSWIQVWLVALMCTSLFTAL